MSATAKRWTAEEVKDKLRKRHPATQAVGPVSTPGPWTCIEEWRCIDLLALCATAGGGRVPYARVGYEVKVDRGDYRSELRQPNKRAEAVAMCHEFYFAVPVGLLSTEEIAGEATGRAPLHVPDDVGLIVVDGRGTRVIKEAPLNRSPESIAIIDRETGDPFGADINALVRWVSARPDPRHDGLVEAARERQAELRAAAREAKRERAENQKRWERREEAPSPDRDPLTAEVHVGRSWRGHRLEDDCPCPQEPCGLVALSKVVPDCPQHGFEAAKTIRQSHFACDCKGASAAVQPQLQEAA